MGFRNMIYKKCEKWIEEDTFIYSANLLHYMSSYENEQEFEKRWIESHENLKLSKIQ